jgi:hypothetical protein
MFGMIYIEYNWRLKGKNRVFVGIPRKIARRIKELAKQMKDEKKK